MIIPVHISFNYRGQEWRHDFNVPTGSAILKLKEQMVSPDGTKADVDSFELQLRGRRVSDFEAIAQESTFDFLFLGPEEGARRAERDVAAKESSEKAAEDSRRHQEWRWQQREREREREEREKEEAERAKEPPKPIEEVQVTVKHAMPEMESEITVRVMSNCTVLDVRHAVLAAIGETKLSEVKLVRRQGGALAALRNEAEIGERREFLSMGKLLKAPPVTECWFKITSVQDWADRWLQLPFGGTAKELKQKLCDEVMRGTTGQVKLTVGGSYLFKDADKPEEVPEHERHNLLAEGIPLGPPQTVEVKVTHATSQHFVCVSLLDTATIGELKAVVSERCKSQELRIVRRLGVGSWQAIAESDRLNCRTEFNCMGKALEQPPPGWEAPQAIAYEGPEVVVSICLDRELGFTQELTTKLGSTILSLKHLLAAEDPTHRTKPEDFGLCPSGAPDRPLADMAVITKELLKLDLVPAGAEPPTGFAWTEAGAVALGAAADKFGHPCAGTPFTNRHLDLLREDPHLAWIDFQYLQNEGLIRADGLVEVRLTHALDETSVTVSVPPTATALEVRKAAMLAVGQTKLSGLKLVQKTAEGDFEPLQDGDLLNGRTQLYTVGCSLA